MGLETVEEEESTSPTSERPTLFSSKSAPSLNYIEKMKRGTTDPEIISTSPRTRALSTVEKMKMGASPKPIIKRSLTSSSRKRLDYIEKMKRGTSNSLRSKSVVEIPLKRVTS